MADQQAGIADPYWYEWTVGLRYVIQMLNPDYGIQSVTMQSSKLQGLDDVVVTYADRKKCIQVKHAREDDTLTFGDMIDDSQQEHSLLQKIAWDWKKVVDSGVSCQAELYTNRRSGRRKATVPNVNGDGQKHERPPLVDFWGHIKGQVCASTIDDIVVPERWSIAWGMWRKQIAFLGTLELEFLRRFQISDSQPGLREAEEELLDLLATQFGVMAERERAVPLLKGLDHALRVWTTTQRGIVEAITPEMVYQAISDEGERGPYSHSLPPPEPFFREREAFAESIVECLKTGAYKIVLLTGAPGSGKTSIISYLAYRHNPTINLRYFAFRPITPEMPFLSADISETVKPRVLWGTLLSQLRVLPLTLPVGI